MQFTYVSVAVDADLTMPPLDVPEAAWSINKQFVTKKVPPEVFDLTTVPLPPLVALLTRQSEKLKFEALALMPLDWLGQL